jgi:hypothetical protein
VPVVWGALSAWRPNAVKGDDADAAVGPAVAGRAATAWGRAAAISRPPTLNTVAESVIAAGRVNTQSRPIFRTVSPRMPELGQDEDCEDDMGVWQRFCPKGATGFTDSSQ